MLNHYTEALKKAVNPGIGLTATTGSDVFAMPLTVATTVLAMQPKDGARSGSSRPPENNASVSGIAVAPRSTAVVRSNQ